MSVKQGAGVRVNQQVQASGLLVDCNFVHAVREAGYLSVATALAELVDNSIQAGATEVAITVERDEPESSPTIVVEDNGAGMSRQELEACLKFGGSSRFDDRASFGRFGMGLPAASLSQTRRVEVRAWRRSGSEYEVVLDVDQVMAGGTTLSARRVGPRRSESGCSVVWRSCDRIPYRRLGWLDRLLRADLGRIYRRFITHGTLRLTLNGRDVKAHDPMLLDTKIENSSAERAFEPLQFELDTYTGVPGWVTVNFAVLPVAQWHMLDNVTKRRTGIVGGPTVSVLRAGREIASGWHFMGSKRRENYDDWWRCEIEFDPVLDEHFGITINKQGIRPSERLREALEPALEPVARLLNGRVRQAFEEVKFREAASISCRIAADAESSLPPIEGLGRRSGGINYSIGTAQLPVESMLATRFEGNNLHVDLNIDHPAFRALYQPLQSTADSSSGDVRTALELLILAFARSTIVSPDGAQELLQVWSKTYGRMLLKA
ncbi:ATP-binding protein [Gordonia sp. ABSL11-1]|uniref:ATP-binding protein n=1 Tax=Gordonia sp. ABSL11-1 TaxID=3053924 RepID=UPI00257333E5|nr:ATP-binding protein [Gordonia sp. ABSL11-1]MDL9947328.1 ATP-binding protein [Gordonia sp. ABSL11-1]